MATTKNTIKKDDENILEEETKDLEIEDIDLGDELTAGDIPERYYTNNQKDKDDARKSFERDYNDVMDYEE